MLQTVCEIAHFIKCANFIAHFIKFDYFMKCANFIAHFHELGNEIMV